MEQVGQVGVVGRSGRRDALPDVRLRGLAARAPGTLGTTFPTLPPTLSAALPLPAPRLLQLLVVVLQLLKVLARLGMLRRELLLWRRRQ